MFKKISFVVLVLIAFIGSQEIADACRKKAQAPKADVSVIETSDNKIIEKEFSFVPLNDTKGNKVWVGTFQLIWNDLMDDIIKGPIEFEKYNSNLARALNKKGFLETDISENSYYKTYGYMTPKFKKEIEKNLKEKFDEKSDILNSLEWNPENFLLYAMLKKDFEYPYEFEILNNESFLGTKVKAFGLYKNAKWEQRNNLCVLFYNADNDFAVKIRTKGQDEVVLYRTDNNKTLEANYKDLIKKTKNYEGNTSFEKEDNLTVPYINFNTMYQYKDFMGKKIKNSDFLIGNALQTVKFKLNNKGGSLKSEAAIQLMKSALPTHEMSRHFVFDKKFIMFLKEKDKKVPYFIVEFNNAELFEKN